MNITLILGSIRPNRQSEKPAFFLANLLKERGHVVDFIDLRELNLPVFADTPEQTALPSVQRLISSILASDAVIAVFPEYNHMYSSAFKNALDFLRNRELLHRPLGLVGTSDGLVGGARALAAARGSIPTIGAVIMPMVVPVPLIKEAFPDQATCTNPKIIGMLNTLISEIETYGPALIPVREKLTKPQ